MSLNKLSAVENGIQAELKGGFTDLKVTDSCTIRGNVFPDNLTTPNYVLTNDGSGNLTWADSGGTTSVSFSGTAPISVNSVAVFSAADGLEVVDSRAVVDGSGNIVTTGNMYPSRTTPKIIYTEFVAGTSGGLIPNFNNEEGYFIRSTDSATTSITISQLGGVVGNEIPANRSLTFTVYALGCTVNIQNGGLTTGSAVGITTPSGGTLTLAGTTFNAALFVYDPVSTTFMVNQLF